MKLFLANCILLVCFQSYGQELISGRVYSKSTHKSIPYPTIQVAGTKNIIDADESGYFEINAEKEDSLVITSIGFYDQMIPVSLFNVSDSVLLEERIITLNEIVIGNSEIKTFGIVNKKFGSSRVGGAMAERSEITTLIEIPGKVKSYRINKVYIRAKRFDAINPIRLHIYSVNEYGLPGEELLKKSVIIKKEDFNKREGIISVDIKGQYIYVEEASFFVGIQWITDKRVQWPTGPEIVLTSKVPRILSYFREGTFYQNNWYAYSQSSRIVYFEDKTIELGKLSKKQHLLNMCASAEIEIFPQRKEDSKY